MKLATPYAYRFIHAALARLSRHAYLEPILPLIGVGLLITMFYFPDFDYHRFPWQTNLAVYLREGSTFLLEYYGLLWLFRRLAHQPRWWGVGGVVFYVLIYSYYYATACWLDAYLSRYPNNTDTIWWFSRHGYWERLFAYGSLLKLIGFTLLYPSLLLLIKAIADVQRYRVNLSRLYQLNTRLELDYLKSQVNPHFLFNVLNSLYFLTEEQAPQAAQIVAQLSDIMRYTLYETGGATVSLQKELTFIRNYVALEGLRAIQRTQIEVELPPSVDPAIQIAPLLLITFVENAFKHGVHPTTKPSWVKLHIELAPNELTLRIANSKPVAATLAGSGIGLLNARKRLDSLYDSHYELSIIDSANTYQLRLSLPLSRD